MQDIISHLQRTYTLSGGAHESPSKGMCFMEFVSFISGSPWSDAPPCTSPALSALFRSSNDRLPHDLRQRLMAFVPRVVGLVNPDLEQTLAYLCADRAVRVFAPIALRNRGKESEAKRLEALTPIVDKESAAAANAAACTAANAARAAARAAAAADAADADADAAAAADATAWEPLFQLLEDAVALYEQNRPDPEEALLCKLRTPQALPDACLAR